MQMLSMSGAKIFNVGLLNGFIRMVQKTMKSGTAVLQNILDLGCILGVHIHVHRILYSNTDLFIYFVQSSCHDVINSDHIQYKQVGRK